MQKVVSLFKATGYISICIDNLANNIFLSPLLKAVVHKCQYYVCFQPTHNSLGSMYHKDRQIQLLSATTLGSGPHIDASLNNTKVSYSSM